MKKHRKVGGVIFDLDGTLVNSLDDLADSMNQVLSQLGLPTHANQAYRYFVGDGIDVLARRCLPEEQRTTGRVKQCVEMMKKSYAENWANKTRLYDGIPELLSELVSRAVRLSVLSNKPDDFTLAFATRFLTDWPFAIVTGARENFPKKPDPSGALAIAKEMSLTPDQILYVGDTNTDMQTALAAGMFAIGVLWGFRKEEELVASGAGALISQPLELLDFI